MPAIRPFQALKYDPAVAGDIQDLVAPPYDIIFDAWRDRLYERNPYNIIRLIKTKDEALPGEQPDKYARAAESLTDWMKRGVLRLDNRPAIYVCADTFVSADRKYTRIGFIALVHIEEFGQGIHPHERTLSGPKVDRLNLVKATGTNLSQIFGIYQDPGMVVGNILRGVMAKAPDVDFTDELEVGRRMWTVTNRTTINAIVNFMRDRDIIIADGHHRYETAMAYRESMESSRTQPDEAFDYVSMYFSCVDDPGMLILPTHRKVGGIDGFSSAGFLKRLFERFDVSYPVHTTLDKIIERIRVGSAETSIFGLYLDGSFGILHLKKPEEPKELDVEILHNVIIEGILGLTREDIAAGKCLHFSRSADHVIEDVNSGKDRIGFLMNAIRPEEMFPRVLRGIRMPQKSTYFHPKTLSGLVMYRIDRSSLG